MESVRPGVKLGILPVGMKRYEAVRMTRRSWDSPAPAEGGVSRAATASSTVRVKESQSALRKLMNGMRGTWGEAEEKFPPRYRTIGRWSELRVVRVVNWKSIAISDEAIARSGEEGVPCEGSLVGVSELRVIRLEELRRSLIWCPRASARPSLVCENHAGLWALKFPRMRVSSWGDRRESRKQWRA